MVFLPIPNFERYLISQNGVVLDSIEEEIIQSRNTLMENTKVKLLIKNRTNRFRSVLVTRLILITHKPVENATLNTLWSPKFIDVNNLNISASNLEYDFGDYYPPIPISDSEFYPVLEEHHDLKINLRGEILFLGKRIEPKLIKGYPVVSLTNKNGTTRYIGVYRLLAIVFLQRPFDYSDLVVNHKDGNPLNDNLSNLEWTTYHGNMVHAHDSMILTNHHPIEVMNIATREVSDFFSIGAFCRSLSLSQRETKRLEFRTRMFGAVVNYRGYAIRFKTNPPRWDSLASMDRYKGNAKEVTITNVVTGKVHEFLWFKDSAEFLEVSQYKLRMALKKYGKIKIGDYLVSYFLPDITAGNSVLSFFSEEVKSI